MAETFIKISNPFPACAFFNLHRNVFPQKGWSAESFASFLSSPQVFCVVAYGEAPAALRGFILVQWAADEGEILTFAVDPACQQKGIGTALLKKMLQEAGKKSLKKIFLEVHTENEAGKKIYIKMGFQPIGKRGNYYRQKGEKGADALTFCYFF